MSIKAMMGFAVAMLIAGCSTIPVVPPTAEELSSASRFKHTFVVTNFSESGSGVQGVSSEALPLLQKHLSNYFNIIDETRSNKVNVYEGQFRLSGNAKVSASAPALKHSESRGKEGQFRSGKLWYEACASAEVSLTVTEAKGISTVYSGQGRGSDCTDTQEQYFYAEETFRQSLQTVSMANAVTQVVSLLESGKSGSSEAVLEALDEAVSSLAADLRNRFPHEGQILQILSKTEVLTNLGSAYGLRPGDTLVVSDAVGQTVDPRTGLTVISKTERARLKVVNVNSGLSSIAKAGEKKISLLRIGDKVSTK